jgi:hypothetical protein
VGRSDVKAVYVEWWDPAGHDRDGWRDLDEVLKKNYGSCHTLGWVIREDAKLLTVAATYAADDPDCINVLGYISIPKSVIKKQVKLDL